MKIPVQVEAHVFIPSDESETRQYNFLALQRTAVRGGFWQPITGGVEETDSGNVSAVVREVYEELQVPEHQIRNIISLDHIFRFIGNDGQRLSEVAFGIELKPGTEITTDGREHAQLCWGSLSRIRAMYKWKDNKIALDELGSRLKISE